MSSSIDWLRPVIGVGSVIVAVGSRNGLSWGSRWGRRWGGC